jgi:xanthine dehydrogenase accessory factor
VRTSEKRRQRLKQLDISDEQIDRLYAPVGLDIGSKSAMEIALAIMAQLTQLRASVSKVNAVTSG